MKKFLSTAKNGLISMTQEHLVDALYTEMAEFSFLTKYIFGTGIEEIDVNAWNDVEVQYSSGVTKKLDERFDSPEHAVNVVRRMLHDDAGRICLPDTRESRASAVRPKREGASR